MRKQKFIRLFFFPMSLHGKWVQFKFFVYWFPTEFSIANFDWARTGPNCGSGEVMEMIAAEGIKHYVKNFISHYFLVDILI